MSNNVPNILLAAKMVIETTDRWSSCTGAPCLCALGAITDVANDPADADAAYSVYALQLPSVDVYGHDAVLQALGRAQAIEVDEIEQIRADHDLPPDILDDDDDDGYTLADVEGALETAKEAAAAKKKPAAKKKATKKRAAKKKKTTE